jgi:hypothetical protein
MICVGCEVFVVKDVQEVGGFVLCEFSAGIQVQLGETEKPKENLNPTKALEVCST